MADDLRHRIAKRLGEAWPDLAEDPVYLDQVAAQAMAVVGPEVERLRKEERAWKTQWSRALDRAQSAEDEVERLRNALDEMTALRDNAVRAAEHADQSIDVDLDGLIGDGLASLGVEWDGGENGAHPKWLETAVIDLVRPVVAHAVKRAETSEAAVERLKARHQPRPATQLIRCEGHSKSWSGNHEMFKDCPDCREEEIQVCSNITCCGWPCNDFLALGQSTEGAPDAG